MLNEKQLTKAELEKREEHHHENEEEQACFSSKVW
jgi:hypothetical protein